MVFKTGCHFMDVSDVFFLASVPQYTINEDTHTSK